MTLERRLCSPRKRFFYLSHFSRSTIEYFRRWSFCPGSPRGRNVEISQTMRSDWGTNLVMKNVRMTSMRTEARSKSRFRPVFDNTRRIAYVHTFYPYDCQRRVIATTSLGHGRRLIVHILKFSLPKQMYTWGLDLIISMIKKKKKKIHNYDRVDTTLQYCVRSIEPDRTGG